MGKIWVGTSGFSYKEWRPSFYPEDLPESRFLRHYATRLNSVEIDSTFYRMPSAKTIEGWKNATGDDFRFTLKASQRITHWERLKVPSGALDYLLGIVPRLENRLGMILYQLPPTFPADVDRLNAFLSALPGGIRSTIEFRHESWFKDEIYDLLREHGVALCIQDADDHTTPLEVTAPFTCVRLRRSDYDAKLREEWQHRIRDWAAGGVEVFAYLKHEDNPDAPLIAREFAESLHAVGTPSSS